ncbi:hypothetical protein BH09BAC5_BH09BAC5_00580 [soil metagenome]
MNSRKQYFIRYLIFLLLVATGLFFWNTEQTAAFTHPQSWLIFGFYAILFLLLHLFMLNAENKKPAVFVRRFMGVSTMRLFSMLVIITLYAITHKSLAVVFIWHCLIFYFLFAAFEIVSLFNQFKRKE